MFIPKLIGGYVAMDPYFLIKEVEDLNIKLQIIKMARSINESMVAYAIKLLKEALRECGKTFRRAKVAVLGVSYKANVKEFRGSKTLNIIKILKKYGITLKVHDPYFSSKELAELGCQVRKSLTNAVKGMDCIVITVGRNQFKTLDLKKLKVLMRNPPVIVDFGHVIDPKKLGKKE